MFGMQNAHVMTILASQWRRSFPKVLAQQEQRIIDVDDRSRVLVECNFANEERSKKGVLAIVVHGLEGSSRSHYVLGVAEKLLLHGISTARMNMRNCGGTLHLTPTLYNAGLSADIERVAEHFLNEGFESVFVLGFSLGGNVVLKAAAELARKKVKWVKGVCAISPSLDLPVCVLAIEKWYNRIYEINFLLSLKEKIIQKDKLRRGVYDTSKLSKIGSVREFDDTYTAPDGGYENALDYYTRASALPLVPLIDAPVLIITSQDDPLVPFSSFGKAELAGENITLIAPRHGGHAGFLGRLAGLAGGNQNGNGNGHNGDYGNAGGNDNGHAPANAVIPPMVPVTDRFWAEKLCVDFCLRLSVSD